MTDDIAGRGDPVRTLELMWGIAPETPRRGPKPRASVGEVVAAAIAIADRDGLAALSTRRLAEAVGISPMSVYTYIPSRAELLDLMLDASAAGGDTLPAFDPKDWRANIGMIATTFRAYYLAHPWVIEIATHRPVLGPNTMRAYEAALGAADGLGLDEVEMDQVFGTIAAFVFGTVRDEVRARLVRDQTGLSDDEWWAKVAPVLDKLDYSPFPISSRVGPIVGELYGAGDPERTFRFGLDLILDGLGLLIARKNAAAEGLSTGGQAVP